MTPAENLHIAYLLQQSGIRLDDQGGGIIHVQAIVRHLQQLTHQVTLVSLIPPRKVILTEDLKTLRNASLSLTGAKAFKLFESGVRRMQGVFRLPYFAIFDSLRFRDACINELDHYDIFHERFSMLGIGGLLAAQQLGIPLVLEVNADFLDELDSIGQGPRGLQRLAVRWASSFCFRRAAMIVAVSRQLKVHLIQHWYVPASRIVVLPNGADVESFKPYSDPETVRSQLGLPEAPTAIFVGSFFPWHAPIELIDSFSIVQKTIPEARLYMIGDGALRSQAEDRAHQLCLMDNVTFTGSVPHEHIPGWLAAADVAVAPYMGMNRELWFSPLKLFEYMAAGKAIIASATGQVEELIQHDETGLLVKPGSVGEMANAIIELFQNITKRGMLGENARKKAVEKHSWTQRIKQLEEVYFHILDPRFN